MNLKKLFLILYDVTMHKTDFIIDTFKNINCIFEFIPGGLTRVLQPLDISIKKLY